MKVSVFLKYPQHVLITLTLQSQIINHNIYINSSPHNIQWVSYRYHDKRKSPINEIPIHQASQQPLLLCNITSPWCIHLLSPAITGMYQALVLAATTSI